MGFLGSFSGVTGLRDGVSIIGTTVRLLSAYENRFARAEREGKLRP